MKITELITEDLILLNVNGETKEEVILEMVSLLDEKRLLNDKDQFAEAVFQREKEGTTGIGFHIAIPHGKSDAIKKPTVVFGKKMIGVDWDSFDDTKAKLIFLIGVPKTNAGDEHLKILQMLSRKLIDDEFREQLLHAETKEEIMDLLEQI